MGNSLSDWLALRRDADTAARSRTLTSLVVQRVAHVRPLHVLDLGTGTGANIAYLAPRLAGEQRWLAVDRDPALLEEAAARTRDLAVPVHLETRAMDLGGMASPEIFEGRHLVTASALLDLVSSSWLSWLAAACRRAGASALFTITYSGRNECVPRDPDDDEVFELFNRHQLTDKGLGGPAAGSGATDAAYTAFTEAGYYVVIKPSDWQLGPEDRELQRQLVEGWAHAAVEMLPSGAAFVSAWKDRRLAQVTAGRSRIVVGHYDLAAFSREP